MYYCSINKLVVTASEYYICDIFIVSSMKSLFVIIVLVQLNFMVVRQDSNLIPVEAKNLENIYNGDRSVIGHGARIYKKRCWLCHGNNGKGDGPRAAELNTKMLDFNDSQVINRTDGELYWWIANGGNDMQGFQNTLAKEDIWKVVNYIRKTQNKL